MTEVSPVFRPATVAWLCAIGGFALAGMIYVLVFADVIGSPHAVGPSAFSYSAIGHRALVESLRRSGIPVLVSRDRSPDKAGETALLILAEPRPKAAGKVLKDFASAQRLLLVLPKWRGGQDPVNPSWIGSVEPMPAPAVEQILHEIDPDAALRRIGQTPSWTTNDLGSVPVLASPQLIDSKELTPLVASPQGILVGETWLEDGQRLWVLSDPDVISNHGIGRGDNAALALAIVDAARLADGAVVVDETIHGYAAKPNLMRRLLELPYVVVTAQAAVAIAVLLWAATGRFGAPVAMRRAIEPGKAVLIRNAASLLMHAGHAPEILQRYMEATMRHVAHLVYAPADLGGTALDEWLDRIARARGIEATCAQLRRDVQVSAAIGGVDGRALVAAADRLHRWRTEMIDGSRGHPRRH